MSCRSRSWLVIVGVVVMLAGNAPAAGAGAATRSVRAADKPVPAGFRAQSTSWPSPAVGWVLGDAPCPAGRCTAVVTTSDGGRHWRAVNAPGAALTPFDEPGVSVIRFADATHGWAFGPSLFATADGGATWRPVRMPEGRQALSVAVGDGVVYLAVSPCDLGKECTRPPTVWRTPLTRTAWLRLRVRVPLTATQVVLAARGRVAYVLATLIPPDSDLFYASTDNGLRWRLRPTPCVTLRDEALVDIAPVSGTSLALLCLGNPGRSRADKHVFRSPDAGLTTVDAGLTPTAGIPSRLAATATRLVVTSFSAGSWLYLGKGVRKWETVLDLADGGLGWNDPVMTTERTGYVVYDPAVMAPDRTGTLLRTTDGGATWSPVNLAGPGSTPPSPALTFPEMSSEGRGTWDRGQIISVPLS